MEVEFLKERIIAMLERATREQLDFLYRFLVRTIKEKKTGRKISGRFYSELRSVERIERISTGLVMTPRFTRERKRFARE